MVCRREKAFLPRDWGRYPRKLFQIMHFDRSFIAVLPIQRRDRHSIGLHYAVCGLLQRTTVSIYISRLLHRLWKAKRIYNVYLISY